MHFDGTAGDADNAGGTSLSELPSLSLLGWPTKSGARSAVLWQWSRVRNRRGLQASDIPPAVLVAARPITNRSALTKEAKRVQWFSCVLCVTLRLCRPDGDMVCHLCGVAALWRAL